jgi:hypothetical protein
VWENLKASTLSDSAEAHLAVECLVRWLLARDIAVNGTRAG